MVLTQFPDYLKKSPFIAILRGITPDEIIPVAEVLIKANWRIIEVPLNSPNAFESIQLLQQHFGKELLLGAGTVCYPDEVEQLASIGAKLMVCPHTDPALIRQAKLEGLTVLAGVSTPSECITALKAGADGLKLFPAEVLGIKMLSALRQVLPKNTLIIPVGGVNPNNIQEWKNKGSDGFGIGGSLYQAGDLPEKIYTTAMEFNQALIRYN